MRARQACLRGSFCAELSVRDLVTGAVQPHAYLATARANRKYVRSPRAEIQGQPPSTQPNANEPWRR
jgi:hypothetical protein